MIDYKQELLDEYGLDGLCEEVDLHELADTLTDPMTAELLDWYREDLTRLDYIEEAIEMGAKDGWQVLASGQYCYHRERLYEALNSLLEEQEESATA